MRKRNMLNLSVILLVLAVLPRSAYSEEFHLTPEMIKTCINSYKARHVIAARKFFDNYAKGTVTAEEEKEVVKTMEELKITRKQAAGKFIIYSAYRPPVGGEMLIIIFQKNRDIILNVWLMDYDPFVVVGVWMQDFSAEEKKYIWRVCKPLLDNPDYGF